MCPVTTYLVLNEKLDALDGSSSGLRDGGGDTTHCCMLSACCCELRGPTNCGAARDIRHPAFSRKRESECECVRPVVDFEFYVLKKSTTKGYCKTC